METEDRLRESDLPALYQAADAASLEGQQEFLRVSRGSLSLLVIAALAGAFVWKVNRTGSVDWAGVVAAISFAIALLLRITLATRQPERRWYQGRAVAESVKTLAWRYAVGGEPFQISSPPDEADGLFTARVHETLSDLKELLLVATSGDQISGAMRKMRTRSLADRREIYRKGRIEDQCDWYTRKAQWNENCAKRWSAVLLVVESFGVVAAILKATGVVEIDMLGFAGTLAAAGTSWVQIKQHSTLAAAYAIAAQELANVKARISSQMTEVNWAQFMNEAEEAISREHTLWCASRGQK